MPGGAQQQAGVMKNESELSTLAIIQFAESVNNELGGATVKMPCGPDLVADPGIASEDLMNRELFPEFHARWVGPEGIYTKLAQALNVKGQTPLFPIVDPFHLASMFGVSMPDIEWPFAFVGIAPPDLLAMLPGIDLTPPEFIAKMMGEIKVPPEFPIKIPEFNILPKYTAQIEFNFLMIKLLMKLPGIFFDLVGQLPSIAPPDLGVELIKIICKPFTPVFEAIDPKHSLHLAATKTLVNKFAESAKYALVASLLGCPDPDVTGGPGFGIVGAMGTVAGLGKNANEKEVVAKIQEEEKVVKKDEDNLRDSVVKLVKEFVPSGYKIGTQVGTEGDNIDWKQEKFVEITQTPWEILIDETYKGTTCGFLTNFVLYRMGCRDPKILNRKVSDAEFKKYGIQWKLGENTQGLWVGGRPIGAWVNWTKGATPKPGDCVYAARTAHVKSGEPYVGARGQANSYEQHVFVFLDSYEKNGNTIWHTADAGWGLSGQQYCRYVKQIVTPEGYMPETVRGSNPVGRHIQGWLDISKVPREEPFDDSGPGSAVLLTINERAPTS